MRFRLDLCHQIPTRKSQNIEQLENTLQIKEGMLDT